MSRSIEAEQITPEVIEATDSMQYRAALAYCLVASSLNSGRSEAKIANAVKAELKTMGITDFWYNLGIMVLVGEDRFRIMAAPNYSDKTPQENVILKDGMPFFIDIHPQNELGRWGNFAATGIFKPSDDEAVRFLTEMQIIQQETISSLTPVMSGADIARNLLQKFEMQDIQLVDVRSNFGHSMGSGLKQDYKRLFLDENTQETIGGLIIGIEPGGYKPRQNGTGIVVARFEDCVHISLNGEPARVLGRNGLVANIPTTFGN